MLPDFAHFVARVRQQVEARLGPWLDARVAEARGRGPDVGLVADGVRQLTLRGGKRLRAVLVAAAYEACGGDRGAEAVAPVGAALELFQTYLLTHDDLIDGGEVREWPGKDINWFRTFVAEVNQSYRALEAQLRKARKRPEVGRVGLG